MAYSDGDYRLVVRGTISGRETFTNTWSFADLGSGTLDNVRLAFVNFYNDLLGASSALGTGVTVVGGTLKDLFTGIPVEWDLGSPESASSDNLIPSSCAIRVSITSGTRHGGPFLAGWGQTCVDENGDLLTATQDSVVEMLETLVSDIDAAGFALMLDSPTTATLGAIGAIRLGKRFDVIRRRINDVAEAYAPVTLP